MYDTGWVIEVDTEKIPEPLTGQPPIQGVFSNPAAVEGGAGAAALNPNKFNSAAKMQSIRMFHGFVRMRGKDGADGTFDDTVLLLGGKFDPITASETADVFAPKESR